MEFVFTGFKGLGFINTYTRGAHHVIIPAGAAAVAPAYHRPEMAGPVSAVAAAAALLLVGLVCLAPPGLLRPARHAFTPRNTHYSWAGAHTRSLQQLNLSTFGTPRSR